MLAQRLFLSLPVTDLDASVRFYRAWGFEPHPTLHDAQAVGLIASDALQLMLMTHAKWREFTELPFSPAGTASHMVSLSVDSRAAVDACAEAAVAHGGRADVNPVQDHGGMYGRDLADPDGHLWGLFWMEAPDGAA